MNAVVIEKCEIVSFGCISNTVITPHCAWTSVEARLRLMNIMEENLASFINTGKGINRVGV